MGSQVISKGKLAFWKFIRVSHFILSTIENGYKLPFAFIPSGILLTDNRWSTRLHADFLSEPVSELLYS